MPTRSKSTRSSTRAARKTARPVRARASTTKRVMPAITVAAKQLKDTVKDVRKHPGKMKTIGTAAAVAAGLITAGMLLKRR